MAVTTPAAGANDVDRRDTTRGYRRVLGQQASRRRGDTVYDYQLFDYYPASSYDIKAAAEQTRGRVGAVRTVVSELEADHRRAVAAVEGTLEGSVHDAPSDAVTQSSEVMRTAEYAAGCLELFGVAVDDYNRYHANPKSISQLNFEYATAIGNRFGVAPLSDDATAEQVDEFSEDLASARTAKIYELTQEKHRLEGWLDGEAGDIATMLNRGPNDNDLQTLWSAGVLPPYAPILYSDSSFSAGDLPPDAQQELKQYLIDHPDVLLNPPPELAALIAGLPSDVRTDIYVEQRMEQLRRECLLTGPNPGGRYEEWIRNSIESGVSADTVIAIARDHDIRPDDFDVLNGLQEITDPDGKSFFVLDTTMSGDAARAAVLMTYILNAGTDYENGDFEPTPYSSAEVQRIIDRQEANGWSYDDDVGFVHGNGGRLITTPNGMLMGAGGNELQDLYGQQGGTTWGDIFMIGQDDIDDPQAYLEQMITTGKSDVHPDLDLDRLLHHEERHSQQWAQEGYTWFILQYLWDAHRFEEDAGLADGGY